MLRHTACRNTGKSFHVAKIFIEHKVAVVQLAVLIRPVSVYALNRRVRLDLGALDVLLDVLDAVVEPWTTDDNACIAFRKVGNGIPSLRGQLFVQVALRIPVPQQPAPPCCRPRPIRTPACRSLRSTASAASCP